MEALLTRLQMRTADEKAIQTFHLPELLLMEHAALALVQALESRFSTSLKNTHGVVLAGPGNNGGDVLAAVRLLLEKGCALTVVCPPSAKVSATCAAQRDLLQAAKAVVVDALAPGLLEKSDWVLDGLMGIGLDRPLAKPLCDLIEEVNTFANRIWIVSADIPSGLCADTGRALPCAIRASETVTFGFYKRGLVTGDAAAFVGKLRLAPIQIPRQCAPQEPEALLFTANDAHLPERGKASHKGDFGKVAVIAGPTDKEGAAALAALGVLRAGAGLVTVFARAETLASLRPRLAAEIMTAELSAYQNGFAATVVGPGLGDDWKTVERVLAGSGAVVLDADALGLLVANESKAHALLRTRKAPTVLTPHPKEAGRLLGVHTDAVQADRYGSIRALQTKWQCAVILKGAGSLCTVGDGPILAVPFGDAGLAKGGTGDVLAGVLASFLAQGIEPALALPLAVCAHGTASERLTEAYGHTRSTLASEVANRIANVLSEWECRPSK